MEFNYDLTRAQISLFSGKKCPTFHPELFFNGSSVTKNEEHKHVGLSFQSNLSFDHPLNEKLTKAKKIICILKHLFKCLTLKCLNQMYKNLVRFHLDYM